MKNSNLVNLSSTNDEDVLCSKIGSIGHIVLNRPYALNSLTDKMIATMLSVLNVWANDDDVCVVVVEGASSTNNKRPFCSGGDIRMIFEGREDPQRNFAKSFFSQEYRLNNFIQKYPKPYLSLIDGVVMGGGVGISIHGSHRVVTDRVLFSMPETGIGLFPDVGGTYFLPRLPGLTGIYIALTSQRLNLEDCIYLGIGTHYVRSTDYQALVDDLKTSNFQGDAFIKLDNLLEKYLKKAGTAPISKNIENIKRCFGASSLDEIYHNLKLHKTTWSSETLRDLSKKSPTSLKVTFKQLSEFKHLDFEDVMKLEYRMVIKFNFSDDLFEGIRAFIIDKDFSPAWNPKNIKDVEDKLVNENFQEPDSGDINFRTYS